jgi:sugar phosphate isomerase/epimerase
MQRRRFLQLSALATSAAALSAHTGLDFDKPVSHLGVQLWSVREDMNKDAKGSVEALAKMGYREVEGFGYNDGKMFGLSMKDYAKLLRANAIAMPSTHYGMGLDSYDTATKQIKDSAKKAIDDFAAMGTRYVICPYLSEELRPKIAELIPVFSAAADYCAKAGVKFGYHNHDFEYTQKGPDGRLLMEWLLHELDPKKVAMEMDLYWVVYANHNPLDWFKAYPGRFELCHAKDMARSTERETIEVGDGSVDFAGIFKKSAQAGLKYYIVELEHYKTTPLQGVKKARENFLKIRF